MGRGLPALGEVGVSEYQYYEFVAIDRPLTMAQQAELRAVSTRGQISSSSFVNEYQWGDLKADPRKWMERYFDAFLYLANWGTHRISLRLPVGVLSVDTAAAYCRGESAHTLATGTHVIIDLHSEDEDGDECWEQEGTLASIVPARAELAAGDHRLLYLAWLLCVQSEELDEDEPEPAVPPGLARLSGPLRALADFLRLDADLLDAAAEASPPMARKAPSEQALSRWVKAMPQAGKDDTVLRLLRGDDAHLRSELLRSFHGPAEKATASGRTSGSLLAAAQARSAERQRHAAAERRRLEEAATAGREARLRRLADRQEETWQRADALIETNRPNSYDTAVELLLDLEAVAERTDGVPEFRQRVRSLRDRHARKTSLLDRLDRHQLR